MKRPAPKPTERPAPVGPGRHRTTGRIADDRRIFRLNDRPEKSGPVLYWMSRDQRAADNWALLHAQNLAVERGLPLAVVFCLSPGFLSAPFRHFDFMIRGLAETERTLLGKSIPFFLLRGDPRSEIPRFAKKTGAGRLVTDFDPLRIKRRWTGAVAKAISVPLVEVDAHNIVPCRAASDKREWGAYTLRPKIHRLLSGFLEPFPALRNHPNPWGKKAPAVDWDRVLRGLRADRSVGSVKGLEPGPSAALRRLRRFLRSGLGSYPFLRNDPVRDGQSGLSPYLHFGHLSAQRVALEVQAADADPAAKEAFIEELVVRRELADNYCLHEPEYDSVAAFPEWARRTLDAHRPDLRPYRYSGKALEAGLTHDALWNAAQAEMVRLGKMHGYLRMYWAKKILEWTESPEEAMETAVRLNDRYSLDGRDPNGYAGIAWSIGGVHDRAWGERPVFGKIRYMSYGGCRTKFDVEAFIRKTAE